MGVNLRAVARVLAATAVLAACGAFSRAHATVVLPTDFEGLVRAAGLVVRGRVVDVSPRLSNGRRRVERVVTLEAFEYYKGGDRRDLQVIVPGGRLGHLRTVTVGAPAFAPGDEVVLFLSGDSARGWYVVGTWQGVFRVRSALLGGGTAVVVPAPPFRDAGGAPGVVKAEGGRSGVRLDDFASRVRQVAARSPRRRGEARR